FQTKLKKTFTYLYNHDREWLDANLPSKRDTLHTPKNPHITLKNNTGNRIEYGRALLSDAIKECPDVTRVQLRKKVYTAYDYLYNNDKECFDAILHHKRQETTMTNEPEW